MKLKTPSIFFAVSLLFGSFLLGRSHGWHSLFDGKTLDGWTVSEENPDSFLVEDGVLVAKGGRAHLFYSGSVGDADFKNFELKLKAKTTPGSNSGVYFHTKYQGEGWPYQGFECQVNTTQKDPKKTGSLYGVANIYVGKPGEKPFVVRFDRMGSQVWKDEAPSTDGEWFDYHIIVKDDTVTLRVNGKTMVEWQQQEGWNGPNDGMRGRVLGSGTFAIQAHDPKSEVHYKDIKVKVLK